jgi:hypothetical protein
MKFAKIEFASESDAAKALHGLMQRCKVTVLRDQSFIVPNPALAWLDSQHIPYKLLQPLNQDDVVQTLRDHLAHPV